MLDERRGKANGDEYQEAFRLGVERGAVKIYHAGRELLLEVEDLGPKGREDLVASVSTGLSSTPSSAAPIKGSAALGYSRNFDLAEAMPIGDQQG